jgi:hypothetical protein
MITKVISAFPGTGKSYLANKHDDVLDLDSHNYTSGHTPDGKVRNPDFPSNYISAIEGQLGKWSILLVSPHAEVIKGLSEKDIEITLVYPDRKLKSEYIERFRKRGSSEAFISPLDSYWDDFLDQLEQLEDCRHVVLKQGQYLSDVLGE